MDALTNEIQQLVSTKLYEQYPYMKTSAIHAIAQQCTDALNNEVEAQMPETKAAEDRFNFFTLPPELRNQIYEPLLIRTPGNTGELPKRKSISMGSSSVNSVKVNWSKQPPLTMVSRQIRKETLPIYYGSNTFVSYPKRNFVSKAAGAAQPHWKINHFNALKWLESIGIANLSLVKAIFVKDLEEETELQDWLPAARFIAHAARSGVVVP